MLPPKWSYPSHLRDLFEKSYGSLRVKTINMLGCFAHKDVTLLCYWSEFVYRQCLYVMCAKMNNFLLSKTCSYTQQNRKYVQFSSGIKQNFFIYILWISICSIYSWEKQTYSWYYHKQCIMERPVTLFPRIKEKMTPSPIPLYVHFNSFFKKI